MRRFQVVELPPIRRGITGLPSGGPPLYELPHAHLGPAARRRTLALHWTAGPGGGSLALRGVPMSRRQVQELLHDVFGVALSLGTISTLEADTARLIAQP